MSEKPVLVTRAGVRWYDPEYIEPTHQAIPLDPDLPMPGTWVENFGSKREVFGHAPGSQLLLWTSSRDAVYSYNPASWTPCDPPEERRTGSNTDRRKE